MVNATPKATVLFDGDCAFCQKSISILKRLDWFHRLDYHSAREFETIRSHSAPLEQQKMIEEMHVLTTDGSRSYAGFKAFRWIAGRLPALWLTVPFLYIPGIPFLGQKIYLWVARNRFNLVPCHDGQCAVPVKKK